jgi:hypothetical protein
MKRIAILAAVLAVTLPLGAGARINGPANLSDNLGTLIEWSTLAASRTATISGDKMQGMGLLNLYVDLEDANDSETGVSIACTTAYESGKWEYRIPACVWSAANTRYDCEAGPLFWNPSDETSADIKRQVFRIDTEGLTNVTCVFSFTGGAAGDRIRVRARKAVK